MADMAGGVNGKRLARRGNTVKVKIRSLAKVYVKESTSNTMQEPVTVGKTCKICQASEGRLEHGEKGLCQGEMVGVLITQPGLQTS